MNFLTKLKYSWAPVQRVSKWLFLQMQKPLVNLEVKTAGRLAEREIGRRMSHIVIKALAPQWIARFSATIISLRLWSIFTWFFTPGKFIVRIFGVYVIIFGIALFLKRKYYNTFLSYVLAESAKGTPLYDILTFKLVKIGLMALQYYAYYWLLVKAVLFAIALAYTPGFEWTMFTNWIELNKFIQGAVEFIYSIGLQKIELAKGEIRYLLVDLLAANHAAGAEQAWLNAETAYLKDLGNAIAAQVENYYRGVSSQNMMLYSVAETGNLAKPAADVPECVVLFQNPVALTNAALNLDSYAAWQGAVAAYQNKPLPTYWDLYKHYFYAITGVLFVVCFSVYYFYGSKGAEFHVEQVKDSLKTVKDVVGHPLESSQKIIGSILNPIFGIDPPKLDGILTDKDLGLIKSTTGPLLPPPVATQDTPLTFSQKAQNVIQNIYHIKNEANTTISNSYNKVRSVVDDHSWKTVKDVATDKSGIGAAGVAGIVGAGVVAQQVPFIAKAGQKFILTGAKNAAQILTGVDVSEMANTASALNTVVEATKAAMPTPTEIAKKAVKKLLRFPTVRGE